MIKGTDAGNTDKLIIVRIDKPGGISVIARVGCFIYVVILDAIVRPDSSADVDSELEIAFV